MRAKLFVVGEDALLGEVDLTVLGDLDHRAEFVAVPISGDVSGMDLGQRKTNLLFVTDRGERLVGRIQTVKAVDGGETAFRGALTRDR